jgi:hypothetical protein
MRRLAGYYVDVDAYLLILLHYLLSPGATHQELGELVITNQASIALLLRNFVYIHDLCFHEVILNNHIFIRAFTLRHFYVSNL